MNVGYSGALPLPPRVADIPEVWVAWVKPTNEAFTITVDRICATGIASALAKTHQTPPQD
jgi:hypothetical protein